MTPNNRPEAAWKKEFYSLFEGQYFEPLNSSSGNATEIIAFIARVEAQAIEEAKKEVAVIATPLRTIFGDDKHNKAVLKLLNFNTEAHPTSAVPTLLDVLAEGKC